MSGGHCTYPTGGPAICLKNKKTDEAQDAFLASLVSIVGKFFEVFSMPDLFPLSVILHFPPEVYLSRGVGDLWPLLVRALHANKISALQFLRGGRVREPTFREELLSNDFVYEGRKIPVRPAGVHTVTVYVHDLPVELSDDSIKSAFSSFGEVFSISHAHFKDFSGTAQWKPSSVNVCY